VTDKTKIEWTDATWNPVTGCTKVSAGCDHCYAETIATRFAGSKAYPHGFDVTLRPERLAIPLKWQRPRRIFVNSMSDLFHSSVPDDYIAMVFAVMAATPRHTYQILTKRHGRLRALLSSERFAIWAYAATSEYSDLSCTPLPAWPLPNVWIGVSVEDQATANLRIPALLETPAAVRFLSCEPLLRPLDLRSHFAGHCPEHDFPGGFCIQRDHPGVSHLHWVIAGGESGHGARPMHPNWARSLRDQCQAASVPFLFKQWGEWGPAPWSVRVCDPAVGWQGTKAELAAAKVAAEAQGATHHIQPSGHLYEAEHKPWSLERDPVGDYPGAVRRWGKKAAGRELDGRTWDQFPEVAHV
jgi:protein gp37